MMKKLILLPMLFFLTISVHATPMNQIESKPKYQLLKEMFSEMVEKKNAQLIPIYYDDNFLLYSNGKIMNFQEMVDIHEQIYQTDIQYKIEYDEQTVVEASDRVSVRMFITTSKPNEQAKELELILIATYKDNKILRIWELTYPDWSQDDQFKEALEKEVSFR